MNLKKFQYMSPFVSSPSVTTYKYTEKWTIYIDTFDAVYMRL